MSSTKPTTVNITMQRYQHLWDTMVIRPEWQSIVAGTVHTIKNNQSTYELFVQSFNKDLPWYVVAAVHMMEASGKFDCHLHNGDSLKQRTTHEPKGRPIKDPLAGKGKAYMWHESAKDALAMKSWHLFHVWDIPHILYRLELYNGMGYVKRRINTPYLFSSTNHYTKGKYVADGHYDPNAVSKQVGAAAIIRMLV